MAAGPASRPTVDVAAGAPDPLAVFRRGWITLHLPLIRHHPDIKRRASGGAASSRAPVGFVLRAAGGGRAVSRGHRRPVTTRRAPAPFLLKQFLTRATDDGTEAAVSESRSKGRRWCHSWWCTCIPRWGCSPSPIPLIAAPTGTSLILPETRLKIG